MADKRATMLDAITLEVPEWLASDSIEADIVTMIRVAESYRQNLAAVTRDAHGNPRPTRLEAARAARKAGFDINELLENILVHLPARELFRNQRVSKNFKETIEKSVKIQEKQFLKTKPNEPVFKTMVCGYQQPAAMSNTLFAPLKPLAERASSGINVHGLTLTHPAYFTLESSLMKTFLMDTSCTLKAMSFQLSIGGCEPYIFVGFDNLVVRGTWTVGDIFHEILSLQCYMPIIYKGAAEEHREQSEWCPIWWTSLTNAWADPKTPTLDRRPDVMRYELSCTADSRNKFWRFKIQYPPRELIAALDPCECLEISFRPAQGPMFVLNRVVIPSPQEYAAMKAKKDLRDQSVASQQGIGSGVERVLSAAVGGV